MASLKITVNGKEFNLFGDNISIKNGNVVVDGKVVDGAKTSDLVQLVISEGMVKNLNVSGDVECKDVEGDIDAGGSIQCGNVNGDVDAGGSVQCKDVGGNVDAGGSVNCDFAAGNVDAGGSVRISNKGG